jgi:outer membrane protein assembly complex protein YaeT
VLRRYDIQLEPPIDPTTADDAAFFLREHLRGMGFPEADVTYDFRDGELVFSVNEGPRFQLGRVTFSGDAVIPSERMHDIVFAAMRQFTRTPFGALRYVYGATEEAAAQLAMALVQEGYLDASVVPSASFAARFVDVDFEVVSGQRYRVRSIRVSGEVPTELARRVREGEGRPYRPGAETLARAALFDGLRRKGFFNAEVAEHIELDPASGSVDIVLDATPGPPFRFGTVRVEGNVATRTRAILSRLGIVPGALFDASRLDEGTSRLWFTGAFSDVDAETESGPGETVEVTVAVTEARAKQLSATVGYGQWERGIAQLSYVDRNFFGTLNRFAIEGVISSRTYGGTGSLSTPSLFNTDATGVLGGFYLRRELPAFRSTFYGVSVAIERTAQTANLTGWRLAYTWKVVTDSEVFADDALDGALLNYTLGSVSLRQTLDRRNDSTVPTSGYLLDYEGTLASEVLGGEVSFGKLNAQATWYLPFRKPTPERPLVPFLVLNHKAGVILPFGGTTEIPVQERFFLGGPDSVRSFQFDGMPPRDEDGTPTGGLAYLLGNAEVQWPVWRNIFAVGFVDVGNLATSVEDFMMENTRVAVGLGGRLYTPVGAVRVDYGYNLIRRDGDPIGAWQIGFGFTF